MRFHSLSTLSLLAGFCVSASADSLETRIMGFNSGTRMARDNKVKSEMDYNKEFEAAKGLQGAPVVFSSVRLFTMMREYNDWERSEGVELNPAIAAAIGTNTRMLLGVWCSESESIDNKIKALHQAVNTWGPDFTRLVDGISVGSEDIFRHGKGEKGQPVEEIIKFVNQVRGAINKTEQLRNIPVGHAEPWGTFLNISDSDLVRHIDFIGANIYPYYEDLGDSAMAAVPGAFEYAVRKTEELGKPVWITETGWPVKGQGYHKNVASETNARSYWQTVGCGELFYNTTRKVWWYTMVNSNPNIENDFGIIKDLDTKEPMFSLGCTNQDYPPKSSSSIAYQSPTTLRTHTINSQNATMTFSTTKPATTEFEVVTTTITTTVAGAAAAKSTSY